MHGDEEEDGYDDLDNEFDLGNHSTRENPLSLSVAMLSSRMSVALGGSSISGFATPSEVDVAGPNPDIPLLTYDQAVIITNLCFLFILSALKVKRIDYL